MIAILAGGLGTRLRPLTEKCPKPLVAVGGKPFLEWQLLEARRQGFKRILLLVAYLGEMIRDAFGDGSRLGLEISYAFEPEPLGTGGALKLAVSQLDSEFLLLNGDSFLRAPFAEMIAALRAQPQADALVSTYDLRETVPVPPNLRVQPIPESPLTLIQGYERGGAPERGFRFVDSGVYAIRRTVIESAPEGKFQLEGLWPGLIARGALCGYPVAERFYDIGDVDRLRQFEEKIRDYFPNPVSR